jgi:hypothetical protein
MARCIIVVVLAFGINQTMLCGSYKVAEAVLRAHTMSDHNIRFTTVNNENKHI